MVASLTIIGFGSGASFLGALSTGLKVIPGYPGTHHQHPPTALSPRQTNRADHSTTCRRRRSVGGRLYEHLPGIDQRHRRMYDRLSMGVAMGCVVGSIESDLGLAG
jgi:hypothetical protein